MGAESRMLTTQRTKQYALRNATGNALCDRREFNNVCKIIVHAVNDSIIQAGPKIRVLLVFHWKTKKTMKINSQQSIAITRN